jgi:hypothetical protein
VKSFVSASPSVRPELVEGLFFPLPGRSKKKQCFDKLSTNGVL